MFDIQHAQGILFDAWESEIYPKLNGDVKIWYDKTDNKYDNIATKYVHIEILKAVAVVMYKVFPKPNEAVIPIVNFREIVSAIAMKSPNPKLWHQKVGSNIRGKSKEVLQPQSFRYVAKNLQRYYMYHIRDLGPKVKMVKGKKRKFSGLDQTKLYTADQSTELN